MSNQDCPRCALDGDRQVRRCDCQADCGKPYCGARYTGRRRPAWHEILPGPKLVCGCPVDSGCDGRHPGALGAVSGYDER